MTYVSRLVLPPGTGAATKGQAGGRYPQRTSPSNSWRVLRRVTGVEVYTPSPAVLCAIFESCRPVEAQTVPFIKLSMGGGGGLVDMNSAWELKHRRHSRFFFGVTPMREGSGRLERVSSERTSSSRQFGLIPKEHRRLNWQAQI